MTVLHHTDAVAHLADVAETEKLFTNAEHEYSRKLISLMPEFKGMSREGLEIAS
jgi:peptide/nickel transport system ATP-binding protein